MRVHDIIFYSSYVCVKGWFWLGLMLEGERPSLGGSDNAPFCASLDVDWQMVIRHSGAICVGIDLTYLLILHMFPSKYKSITSLSECMYTCICTYMVSISLYSIAAVLAQSRIQLLQIAL